MSKLDIIEKEFLKKSVPEFKVGDEVKIHLKVLEGDKTRIQIYAGTVIRRRGHGTSETFTVLKEVRDDIVEKTFLLHSPHIEKIAVTTKGKVKKAKLYHLRRKKPGKS